MIHPNSELLADSGYQGLNKFHENSVIPMKKKIPHTDEAKTHNKALSKRRILIENIFRSKKEVYRGKHKNDGLTWRLVAALVNLRYNSI